MVGDQRKNYFTSPIILDGTRDHYKVKRKKTGLSRNDLDMKSYISLKWDDSKMKVVAKTEQVGIPWRELIRFADGILPCDNILADVVIVPPEIFTLDNLADVLTYEVWQNCLSESERHSLTQFLPKCSNPDRVVQQLFRGDNFHFGNPFLKWGALLCSGNLHPDNILTTERSRRDSKKAYYSELQTYHREMIKNLQIWKERAVDCKDLKEDIIQRMWRSRNNSKKRIFTPEPGDPEVEENVYTTPESTCRGASEIVCSSDNPNGFLMLGEISRRKGSITSKIDTSPDGELGIEETLLKHNGQHGDGARYMSYIKVSKSQHQRIKISMKHSSNSFQPKSLNSVLGNIDALHIQPFEVFEKEEWQKVHDHWLKLAVRDLPPFVSNWRILQLGRIQITKSLGQEMEEKFKCQNESIDQDKEDSACDLPLEPQSNLEANFALTEMKELEVAPSMSAVELPDMTFEETPLMIKEEAPATTLDMSPSMTEEEAPAMNDEEAPSITEEELHALTEEESPTMTNEESCKLSEEDELQTNGSMEEQQGNGLGEVGLVTFEDNERENCIRDVNNVVSVSTQSDNMHQTVPLNNGCHHYDAMDIESETHDNLDLKKEEGSPSLSKYPSNLVNIDVPVNREDSIASAVDAWPQVNMPGLFYNSTPLGHGYSSSNELSLSHPQVEEQPSQLHHLDAFNGERIDGGASLDAFNGEKNGGRDALPVHSGPSPFFSPYHSQDQNELYQSFYKSETDLSYQHKEKPTGIDSQPAADLVDFQPAANLVVETGQFSGQMREQLHSSLPLELTQKGLRDFYLNQNIQESMYSDGGSYPIQRQETMPINVRDWAANTVHMPAPPQSHMNGGLQSQDWFAGDNPARDSWSTEGVVGPSQGIGSGSSSDQSLFRVLSECNELQSGAQYDPTSPSQRFVQPGSGVHTNSHILPQTINPLNYLPDLDSTLGYKTVTSLGTKDIQHQTPGLEETIDNKTFLRSWNQ
ncbi:hypothetical protein Leryth_000426 [Lithospermum erythrorhizon]|nr:hypothetical protein Leryth_000426 [Lithospermum erythrorhizon]